MPTFSFSDVALSVGPFLRHGIHFLCNNTTCRREEKNVNAAISYPEQRPFKTRNCPQCGQL